MKRTIAVLQELISELKNDKHNLETEHKKLSEEQKDLEDNISQLMLTYDKHYRELDDLAEKYKHKDGSAVLKKLQAELYKLK
ncbi:hypothetical protein Tco_0789908 [Tanacetum coccineum]